MYLTSLIRYYELYEVQIAHVFTIQLHCEKVEMSISLFRSRNTFIVNFTIKVMNFEEKVKEQISYRCKWFDLVYKDGKYRMEQYQTTTSNNNHSKQPNQNKKPNPKPTKMFPTKMFAFIAFLLIVLVQLNSIQYAEAGGDDDKIIIGGGHGCPPSFLLKEGKFT